MSRLSIRIAALGAILALVGLPAAAQSPLHGRISYDAGHSMVKGLNDEAWSHAAINTMILPGDNLWADQGGSTELEFSGGTFARLADGSKLEVSSLSPGIQLRAWEGAFYAHRTNRSTGSLVVETPEAFVDVDQDSNVRIDVVREGGTTVSVRWGRATVRGRSGGDVALAEGMRTWVDPGLLPSTPAPYDRATEDAFDTWNRERTKFLAVGPEPAPQAVGITEPALGTAELARYGEWVTIDSRPYWRPTVVVDYVPYRYGYWSTVPSVGNVWVGQYPFCYVTSHYGRWTHHARHGWVWGYHPGWSPAWCATLRVGDYYVWSPVDYYNRPVVVSSASVFTVGGVGFSIYATSYVPVSRIGYGWTYVSPFNTGLVHYIDSHPTQVNIWNIYVNDRPHVRVPYQRDYGMVRNYNPPRAIRGPDAFPGRSVQVGSRVADLESRLGRSEFAVNRGVRGSAGQTRAHSGTGDTRMRSVRLDEERPGFARATRNAPISASQERAAYRERAGIREEAGSRGTERGGDQVPTLSGRGTRESGERGEVGRGTTDSSRGTASVRTREPGATPRGSAPETGLTTRPSTTTDRGTANRTPARQDSGRSGESRITRTPDRGSTERVTPAPGRVERGTAAPERSPSRVTAPERNTAVRAPRVTEAPRSEGRATIERRSYPSAGAAPRTEYRAPRATAPESSQRIAPQRVQPTSPRASAPESSQRVAPQRAPQAAPRVEVPRQPRYEAPRLDSGRGRASFTPRQAPTQRSAPSLRAPAPSTRGSIGRSVEGGATRGGGREGSVSRTR